MKKLIFVLLLIISQLYSQGYKNFKVSVYTRSFEVIKMADLNWLEPKWKEITDQLHVDKIYLETHRDQVIVPEDKLEAVKKFFRDKGIEIAGGITYTISEPNRFQTYCYSKKEDRYKVKEIIEYTAKHFDEVILDDFFFTSCKCEVCIDKKADLSWTDYRLQLMAEASENLILKPAKKVNPNVKVVIKYPNWYAHFQGLGFNLEKQPAMYDGIYTGTETRDAVRSAQHLQQYLGYAIFRYFENLKPGGNGGGWVDTYGSRFLDRYAEQLWITLFAKAPEITLFEFTQLLRPLEKFPEREWKGKGASFDRDELMKPYKGVQPTSIARAAGYAFEKTDPILGALGNPVGIKCYKPYHSTGEDFLPTFLGMIGLPMDIVAEFPHNESMILLTESAAFDKNIVNKIKKQLVDGKSVTITSGLLKALQGKGIEDIAEIRYSIHKALVDEYVSGFRIIPGDKKILIPQIKYLTNDSWELASAIDGPNGWPLLHDADYASGHLYVLTIPDNYADLYHLPVEILGTIRNVLAKDQFVQLHGPANVSMYLYDNKTVILESFLDEAIDVSLTTSPNVSSISNLQNGVELEGIERAAFGGWASPRVPAKKAFKVTIPPHSFRAFKLKE